MKSDRPDRSLEPGTVEAMVRTARPGWRVREATLADRGYTAVYRLVSDAGDGGGADGGTREVVLKAAPDGGDHGLHNLLVDEETGRLRAALDWAFTLAVPPAYDLATVEHQQGGGVWSALPEYPDRRALVREAMLAGYRSAGGEVPTAYDAERPLYDLLATLRAMQHLDAGLASIPDDRADEMAEGLATRVERMLDGGVLDG